jgi:hypothetical protein
VVAVVVIIITGAAVAVKAVTVVAFLPAAIVAVV